VRDGGARPTKRRLPITHDDGTSDGHAGGPAAQYDLVLIAGNPLSNLLFRAQPFPLGYLALFSTIQ
jgi:hypothetical protein